MASIEKRGKNSFRLVVEAGYDANGKRIKRTKTVKVKTKREAEIELAKFVAEVQSGEYIAPEKMTLSAFSEREWLPKYAEKKFAPSSLKHYTYQLRAQILPALGHLRLDQIKTMHLINFFNELDKPTARKDGKEKPLSGATKQFIYKVLKNVLDRAKDWQVIQNNPIDGVKMPARDNVEMKYYDSSEAKKVIQKLYEEPALWRLYFIASMIGGFRRGELLALEWRHVDFDEGTFSIEQSLSLTVDKQPIIKPPKTKSSIRKVDMPEWYMEELRQYRLEWVKYKDDVGDAWEEEREFVFHNEFGRPFHFHTPTIKWRDFIKKHGLKKIRLHDLRHTAATLLIETAIEQGIDADVTLKGVQQRLGHSTFAMTADTYAKVTKRMSKKLAGNLEVFDPRKFVPNSSPKDKSI
ncbi:site-specific integrase [Effusibacillus dendaii]|uniref:Site-specific integrase n=1 Tax=Effusibacillus dendaii TaxID=2743772 RepID=A0A7I8DDA5_9BACL|nr:site-specific integrase [Effusibacillus dendaii]BCJ86510.1 hypothetical protein skT53_14950 [Effusibacillus dendaii]